MKKSILIFLTLHSSLCLFSQFNRTYDQNSSNSVIHPGRPIPLDDGSIVFASWNQTTDDINSETFGVLTRVDVHGNIMFNKKIQIGDIENEYLLGVFSVVTTVDHGLLIATLTENSSNYIKQPCLLKTDSLGNLEWSRTYPVNNEYVQDYYRCPQLARIHGISNGGYLLTFSSKTSSETTSQGLQVMRISENGDIEWSKEFYDSALYENKNATVTFSPSDIVYTPVGDYFMITGTKILNLNFDNIPRLFMVGIDANGTIVRDFRSQDLPLISEFPSVTYDHELNVFAMSFLSYGGLFNTNCAATVIGLMTISNDLEPILTRFYWSENAKENYGMNIFCDSENKYVLTGLIASTSCTDDVIETVSPAVLKVHPNGDPIFFARYNIGEDVFPDLSSSILQISPLSDEDLYTLITRRGENIRIVQTNSSGETCGAFYTDIQEGYYEPTFSTSESVFEETFAQADYPFVVTEMDCPFCSCDDANSNIYCENINSVDVLSNDNVISIFPSLLISGEPLTITGKFTKTRVDVYSATGQLIHSEVINGSKNSLELQTTGYSTGIYLIVLTGINSTVPNIEKFVISE